MREQQRVEERVSKGSKEKIEKQRVLNIPKGIRGMDRMTGERGRRAKSDEIGSTFIINGASRFVAVPARATYSAPGV